MGGIPHSGAFARTSKLERSRKFVLVGGAGLESIRDNILCTLGVNVMAGV
jgi:hypothetical protein